MPYFLSFKLFTILCTVPFTSYSFVVLVDTIEAEGDYSTPRSFTTLQAPPTPPLNVTAKVRSYSSVLVSWSPPACSNGIILGYMVSMNTLQKIFFFSERFYFAIGDIHSIKRLSIQSFQHVKCYHSFAPKPFQ